jgi:rhodanese-related sulfurtransferase
MPRRCPQKQLLPLLVLAMLLCGCSATITAMDLQRRMAETPAPLLVDVRSRDEYSRDHIPGAVRIPFYAIGSGLQERGYPKDRPVVLYCEHGPRAGLAGISLYLQGYADVYSLEGHMQGWRQRGLGLEKTPGH